MIWHDHSRLEGQHALLSPSKKSWLNYDSQSMFDSYASSWASTIGTAIHAFAESRIERRKKLTKSCRDSLDQYLYDAGIPEQLIDIDLYFDNLSSYVNDCIGFRMKPEVLLYLSDDCFGTTDAINYDEKNRILRISDYKSGKTTPSMDQLLIYAALFMIEYKRDLNLELGNIKIELRIYYQNEVLYYEPEANEMAHLIDIILSKNKMLKEIKEGRL